MGKPVLANGRCDVLKGQCLRSNGGLYYESYSEFLATLGAIDQNRWLNASLGRNGRQFFRDLVVEPPPAEQIGEPSQPGHFTSP